jgi:putative ABC transport system permease protein
MQNWLRNFACRISVGAGPFFAAGLAAFGVALATVIVQSLRAALAPPVESIKYE